MTSNQQKTLDGKWVLEVLFDGGVDDATYFLHTVGDVALETNPTAVASVTLLSDLDEWERCRCGRTHDEVTIGG